MARSADLLLLGAGEVVTLDTHGDGPLAGAAMRNLGIVRDGGIAIRKGRVVAVGPSREIKRTFEAPTRVQLNGACVLPGFVDAHTHPVFAADRADEFAMRCGGADYEAILEAGGGIHASARALGEAPIDDLVAGVRSRLDRLLQHGVVAIEGKSGYGLTLDSEIKSLEALRRAGRDHAVHIERTFLGAHVVPEAYAKKRGDYVSLLIDEMIPRVAKRKLASFCDVFVERGAFTVAEARRILDAGKAHGLRPKVHADQFRDGGGAKLAAQVGAISVEHVDATGPAGIRALAKARVIAVLLPTASVFTGLKQRANARLLIDAGIAVALSTDLNPGTSPTANLSLVAGLGCCLFGMTPEEAIVAITRNAAAAIGQEDRFGRIAKGRIADLVILDAKSYVQIPYQLGTNLVRQVYVRGELVV